MKVLVVEDDSIAMKLAATTLEKHDYEVVTASTGKEAVSLLEKKEQVDIIVSDVMMPVMNGFHLLSYLKADARLAGIPVVLCTALNDINAVKKGMELGAVGYVTKPIKPGVLVEKVQAAAEKIPGAVVVVDDEDLLRELLTRALTRDGIKVLPAESGSKALELIEENKTMLVLSDIKMPQMDGLELLVNIKEKYPNLPVFLMTGHGGEFNRDQVLAAGGDGFITKPFRNTEIIRQIRPFMR